MAKTFKGALDLAAVYLKGLGIQSARADAELLLASVTGLNRVKFLAYPESLLNERLWCEFWNWVRQRGRFYPIQYLRGRQEFYGREFLVTPAVLIPRPETELVVECCLDLLKGQRDQVRVLDIGTGSGCIALTLACERAFLEVTAVDISEDALEVAISNAQSLGCKSQVEFLCGDAVDPVKDRPLYYDVVVSNPPYIPAGDVEKIDPTVARYEPSQALFSGDTGLEMYSRLFAEVHRVLKPAGALVLELGFGQAEEVTRLANDLGWKRWSLQQDLSGIDRCAVFHWLTVDGTRK